MHNLYNERVSEIICLRHRTVTNKMADEEESLVPQSEENGKAEELKEELIPNATETEKEDPVKPEINGSIINPPTTVSPRDARKQTDSVVQPLLTGRVVN